MKGYKKLVSEIDEKIQPDKSFDVIKRELIVAERNAVMYFIDGFIKDEVYEKLLEFLLKQTPDTISGITDMKDFAKVKMPYVEVDWSYDTPTIVTAILSGPSVILIDGIKGAILVDTRTYPMRSIEEPQKDKSLRGSRDSFVETIIMNTALIRRRIRDPRLRMEYMQVGSATKLDIAISYLDGVADKKTIENLKNKLKNLKVSGISMTQQAMSEKLQKTVFWNPFPKFKFTERPDYASSTILDGKIVVIMDNSPAVMIVPVSMSDFFREIDDYYFLPIVSTYTRIVRIIVSILDVILTPLYLLAVNNPSYVPKWIEVFLPSESAELNVFWQFIFLELLVDGLRLASLNTPDSLSSSLGIIGGLLLSEFAVNAGWFIGETIMVMAFITIASFSMPSFEMGYALKFERIFILILTQLLGIWGFGGGVVALFIAMLLMKTLSGRNYLYPFIPFNAKAFSELFIRFPMK